MRIYQGSQIATNSGYPPNPRLRRRGRWLCRVGFVVSSVSLIVAGGNNLVLHAQSVEEHEAKAAFVLKIVNFVQWPNTPNEHKSNLVICSIGADATNDALQRLASGKAIDGREIIVRRLKNENDDVACQVIFIGESEHTHVATLLGRLRGASVLTVGEVEGFARLGGIMNLAVGEGRIRLEVNPRAAERAHLQISSRLLSLATIVGDGT